MSFLGNLLWIIFGGLVAALGYFIGGLLLCLTIVGIPFGLQSFRLGAAVLAPFGKEVVPNERAEGGLALLFDILWIILFGWEIAIAHLTLAFFLAITIIGLPFAKQHLKLVPVALLPFGRELR